MFFVCTRNIRREKPFELWCSHRVCLRSYGWVEKSKITRFSSDVISTLKHTIQILCGLFFVFTENSKYNVSIDSYRCDDRTMFGTSIYYTKVSHVDQNIITIHRETVRDQLVVRNTMVVSWSDNIDIYI